MPWKKDSVELTLNELYESKGLWFSSLQLCAKNVSNSCAGISVSKPYQKKSDLNDFAVFKDMNISISYHGDLFQDSFAVLELHVIKINIVIGII